MSAAEGPPSENNNDPAADNDDSVCLACSMALDANLDACIQAHTHVVTNTHARELPAQIVASVREFCETTATSTADERRQKRRKITRAFQQFHAATKHELHALAHVMAHSGVYVSSEVSVPENVMAKITAESRAE